MQKNKKKDDLAGILFKFQQKYNPKDIKINQSHHQGTQVLDVAIRSRGFDQDIIYTKTRQFLRKIRRGNSFIKIDKQYKVLRRGLIKFFDISKQQLHLNIAFVKQYLTQQQNDPKAIHRQFCHYFKTQKYVEKNINIANFMLSLKSIAQQQPVSIFKLIKANGQNGQISYNKDLNVWVLCSKNVALLAKTKKDLYQYRTQQRYGFACQIGNAWFKYLAQLQKNQIQQIKNMLAQHTLVCQYVGHQNHQHLVKYMKPTLLFYAMVKNDIQTLDSCLPPYISYDFFRQHNMQTVQLKHIGQFGHPIAFFQAVNQLFDQVCSGGLDKEEQGSVLYFVGGGRTLSLVKLKTIEYRIWRKLRQKIKHLKQNAQKLSKDFKREVKSLVEQFHIVLDKPMLSRFAFSWIKQVKGHQRDGQLKIYKFYKYGDVLHATDQDLLNKQMMKQVFERSWQSFKWPPTVS